MITGHWFALHSETLKWLLLIFTILFLLTPQGAVAVGNATEGQKKSMQWLHFGDGMRGGLH